MPVLIYRTHGVWRLMCNTRTYNSGSWFFTNNDNNLHRIVLPSLCSSPYYPPPSHTSSVSPTASEINNKKERGDSSVSTVVRLGTKTPWIRRSIPSKGRIFLFFKVSKFPFVAYRGLFLWQQSGYGVKLSGHLHLVSRLRMSGNLPPISTWHHSVRRYNCTVWSEYYVIAQWEASYM